MPQRQPRFVRDIDLSDRWEVVCGEGAVEDQVLQLRIDKELDDAYPGKPGHLLDAPTVPIH